MSSVLTREYSERTSESKTSLDVYKLNDGKRDSEAGNQSFFSEAFYLISVFGFGRNLGPVHMEVGDPW